MTNSTLKTVQSILNNFVDLFFPPVCLHCQTILPESANYLSLCPNCYSQLILMSPDFPKTQIIKRLEPSFLDQMWIGYEFNEIIQSVIHFIKYRKMPNLGIRAGELCAKVLGTYFNALEDRYFLPVPLHPIRRKERGYNQSKFISEGIINIQGGILIEHVLTRNKNTISQTALNRQERQENVHQAFQIRNGVDISGKTIILVDDLITTGATMNECARVLKENGAKRIICVAVASPVNLQLPSL